MLSSSGTLLQPERALSKHVGTPLGRRLPLSYVTRCAGVAVARASGSHRRRDGDSQSPVAITTTTVTTTTGSTTAAVTATSISAILA